MTALAQHYFLRTDEQYVSISTITRTKMVDSFGPFTWTAQCRFGGGEIKLQKRHMTLFEIAGYGKFEAQGIPTEVKIKAIIYKNELDQIKLIGVVHKTEPSLVIARLSMKEIRPGMLYFQKHGNGYKRLEIKSISKKTKKIFEITFADGTTLTCSEKLVVAVTANQDTTTPASVAAQPALPEISDNSPKCEPDPDPEPVAVFHDLPVGAIGESPSIQLETSEWNIGDKTTIKANIRHESGWKREKVIGRIASFREGPIRLAIVEYGENWEYSIPRPLHLLNRVTNDVGTAYIPSGKPEINELKPSNGQTPTSPGKPLDSPTEPQEQAIPEPDNPVKKRVTMLGGGKTKPTPPSFKPKTPAVYQNTTTREELLTQLTDIFMSLEVTELTALNSVLSKIKSQKMMATTHQTQRHI